MAILPEGREENVVASVFTYLGDNYTDTPIDYAGSGVKEEDTDEWIRADVMFTMPRYSRQTDQAGNFGAEPLIMLNINVFQKQTSYEKDTYRLIRLADTLRDLFRVPLGIPVMDYMENAGANRVGTLQTSEIEATTLPFDQGKGLYGRNITSTMRYVFQWEAP
jgi:hypothetical protein